MQHQNEKKSREPRVSLWSQAGAGEKEGSAEALPEVSSDGSGREASLFDPIDRERGSNEFGGSGRSSLVRRQRAIEKLTEAGNGGMSAIRRREAAAIQKDEVPVERGETVRLALPGAVGCCAVGDQQADSVIVMLNGDLGNINLLRERCGRHRCLLGSMLMNADLLAGHGGHDLGYQHRWIEGRVVLT